MTRTLQRWMSWTGMTVTAAISVVCPDIASAGTLSSRATTDGDEPILEIRFTASDRERNRLIVDVRGQQVVVEDKYVIAAGGVCMQTAPTRARCPLDATDATRVMVDTGDRDDRIKLRGTLDMEHPDRLLRDEEGVDCCGGDNYGQLAGGPGEDLISGAATQRGGPGDDVLRGPRVHGGQGNDRLTATDWNPDGITNTLIGGAGRDMMLGGRGDDLLYPALGEPIAASDVVVGGPGDDTLSYRAAQTPVFVRLATSVTVAGRAGERDRVSGVENADGGAHNDVLLGTNRSNVLYGDAGADHIDGRGGNDDIEGDQGTDRLLGGRGSDDIQGGVGRDWLDGGSGNDYLSGDEGADVVMGGGGNDVFGLTVAGDALVGATGDRQFGGPGNDRLNAEAATLDCGKGFDQLTTDSLFNRAMPVQCELFLSNPDLKTQADTDGRAIYIVLRYLHNTPATLTVTLRARDHRTTLGKRTLRIPAAKTVRHKIPLNAAGRRYVSRRPAAVEVHFNQSGGNGGSVFLRWQTRPR